MIAKPMARNAAKPAKTRTTICAECRRSVIPKIAAVASKHDTMDTTKAVAWRPGPHLRKTTSRVV